MSSERSLAEELEERLQEALPRAARLGRPEHRFLALLAALNEALEERGAGRIIVVGGFAVELLAGGALRTLDVDIVVEGWEAVRAVRELLSRLPRLLRGAAPVAESSRGPVLSLGGAEKAVDLVGSAYRPRFPPLEVEVPGFGRVYVEAPEELVLRYLREWAYWGTGEARARVILLLGVLGDRMDLGALERAAREEDPRLARLFREAVELLRRRGLLPG